MTKKILLRWLLVPTLALGVGVPLADEKETADSYDPFLEESLDELMDLSLEELVNFVVVVGSRAKGRSAGDSPVPIDIIDGDEFTEQGTTDILNQLRTLVPSFNVNDQPLNDAATLVRPFSLRGLPPDSTLILVNGKRRHRSAVITFSADGIANGSQGPDLNVIPSIALDRVEVLRDGAAAQYGSDAIAGVINFILKSNQQGGELVLRQGSYYQGDGDTYQIAGNIGLPFTKFGFANLSFEYQQADPTSRSVQRDDAAALIAAGNTRVANPAQIWGLPEIKRDFKAFANFGLDLSDSSAFYLFANVAERNVEGGFFFRNPNTRSGVFSADGGNTLLVGDLTPQDGIACPSIPIVNNVPDPAALATVSANDNCFAFNERFPGGFTPRFGGVIRDGSLALGSRGEFDNGLHYDLSGYVGRNEIDFRISNTVNASLGPTTPTTFDPGQFVQIEKNLNLDLSKPINTDFTVEPVNLAAGFEYRQETFETISGDVQSFEIGPLAEQGFSIGSNGFPGFKPQDAGSFERNSWALYLEGEFPFRDDFLALGALRYENFEDFGTTTEGKFAARWALTERLSIRSSASTGFRAPTVGQNNIRNVATGFTAGVGLTNEATLSPTNPISVRFGGKQLQPEKSVNLSLGVVWSLEDIHMTADYYRIGVTDRIAQTPGFFLSQVDINALVAQGILDAPSFSRVRFFANAFDTTTQGVDLVAHYQTTLFSGHTRFSLAFNWNDTHVDAFDSNIIDSIRISRLEEGLPATKGSLTIHHFQGPWRGLLRLNHYGSSFEPHLGDQNLPIEAGSLLTVDAELGYDINDSFNLVVGAQNLFDEFPDKNPFASVAGSEYSETSPSGFSGGFYYLRLNYSFF